jgi:hypothetical protein
MIRIRNESNIFACSQIPRLTLENIKEAERTCAYDEISTLINKLPKDWIGSDEFGNRKSKTDLLRCAWGQHKEAESVLGFQVAILQKYPPRSRSITQFDTLITSNAYYDGVIWKKAVKNFIFKEVLTSPLCNRTTIFQIYKDSHFTTLLAEDGQYYFYDSIKKNAPIPEVVPKLHSALRTWYVDNKQPKPPILENTDPSIIAESCPLQVDKWSCGIHMLLVTLATIYQGKKPALCYERKDAYLLSQAHLHHELTGELLEPCIGRIVDLLTNPRPKSSSGVAPKKGKKGTKKVPPPKSYLQQAHEGNSQPTLLGTMVCTSCIVSLVH